MLKKSFILFALLVLCALSANAEYYRVVLVDKGEGEFIVGSEKYEAAKASLSARCLQRRAKRLAENELITEKDVPLFPKYIDSLTALGCKIHLQLKWMNYAVVDCSPSMVGTLSNLAFVDTVFAANDKANDLEVCSISEAIPISAEKIIFNDLQKVDETIYGMSYFQNISTGAFYAHEQGSFGQGVHIGIADNGFSYDNDIIFPNTEILYAHDFIYDDDNTANDSIDHPEQDSHGTSVFSILAAETKDTLIGISTRSSYYLAKTEDNKQEAHIEEDQFASAIEVLEAAGVDIISASLGYRRMDDETKRYYFNDLDGETTLISKYANQADDYGVFFCVAAGNAGPEIETIISPADATKAITVGAVDYTDSVADFSSRGPNASEMIKPTISALGYPVACYEILLGQIAYSSGTSLATPIIAGTAALLLSNDMSLSNNDIRKILTESANNFETPNNDVGYGVPNLRTIFDSMDVAIGDLMSFPREKQVACFCRIKYPQTEAEKILHVRFKNADTFEPFTLTYYTENPADSNYFCSTEIPTSKFNNEPAEAYITVAEDSETHKKPFYDNEYFTINPNSDILPLGLDSMYLPPKRDTVVVIIIGVHEQEQTKITVTPQVATANQAIFHISNHIAANQLAIQDISVYNILGEKIEFVMNSTNEIQLINPAPACYFISINTRTQGRTFHKILIR